MESTASWEARARQRRCGLAAEAGPGHDDPSPEDHSVPIVDAVEQPDSALQRVWTSGAPSSPPAFLRVIPGSSGSGSAAPPYRGLEDVPDQLASAAAAAARPRQHQAPDEDAALAAAASARDGARRPLASPRGAASPRHFFDVEQHEASVQAALPVSPNRSTATLAAVARAAGYGSGYGTLLPSAAAGEVLDDDETVEDILEDCISRAACT